MTQSNHRGILIVGHGSPRAEANQGFLGLVGRIASRLESRNVLPAFFSIAQPSIQEQLALLVSRGVTHVTLMPYFLYAGQHVSRDIPVLLDQCRQAHPGVEIDVLPTLENDPSVEDVVVERLVPLAAGEKSLPREGDAIQRRSFEIIDSQLAHLPRDDAARAVIRRVIHATADFSFGRSLRVHPDAIARGRAALAAGKEVICDVAMLKAGLTKVPGGATCAIGEQAVRELAKTLNCTRAAAAMEHLKGRMEGAIVAIGNAPTALWRVMEICRRDGVRPAVVVGLPVGFVGARESKQALMESGLCYITNVGPRGGSPVAAAAVNAIALLDRQEASHEV